MSERKVAGRRVVVLSQPAEAAGSGGDGESETTSQPQSVRRRCVRFEEKETVDKLIIFFSRIYLLLVTFPGGLRRKLLKRELS